MFCKAGLAVLGPSSPSCSAAPNLLYVLVIPGALGKGHVLCFCVKVENREKERAHKSLSFSACIS
jgi:hypothetical protein